MYVSNTQHPFQKEKKKERILSIQTASSPAHLVARVTRNGIEPYLVPRLSAGARSELATLRTKLQQVELATLEDRRFTPISGKEGELRAGPGYRLTMQATGAGRCDYAEFVWRNRAPPLRLVNLKEKNILAEATCELCSQGD